MVEKIGCMYCGGGKKDHLLGCPDDQLHKRKNEPAPKPGQCPDCGMYAGHHTNECWKRTHQAPIECIREKRHTGPCNGFPREDCPRANSSLDTLKALASRFDAPSASQRRKDTPIFSGVMRYFPDALAAVARLSKKGNDKHNPGEPLHWARSKSTDHGDCIARHQLEFDQIDPDTGEYHAVGVAWRALAQLQLLEEGKRK